MLSVLLLPRIGAAQGLLVDLSADRQVRLPRPFPPTLPPRAPRPVPVSTYKIGELDVAVHLADQVAKVQVSQSFINTGQRTMEVAFVFPLPYDGAVDRLTLLIDGKEHAARLLPAGEARRRYESIVRKNRDPALLEWIGRGMFQTRVFPVPAGAQRKVTLRYSQLCRQNHGLTDFLFPLRTARYTSRPVKTIRIRATIESREEIKNVYSPSHAVQIDRPDPRRARVTYVGHDEVPESDFRLFYDVGRGKIGMNVISYRPNAGQDGFFLLMASPEFASRSGDLPVKTVLFVVDRSGSMSGEKLKQAKGTLRFVLDRLRPRDTFNMIAYDSDVESFRDELQKADDATRAAARGFIAGLQARGSTNIDAALKTALSQLHDASRVSYVIFLTDGLPTFGEQEEAVIVDHARRANQVRARLFDFGVGYDVNSRLLDRLARANHGQSEYVRPNEDIEAAVARLYRRIGAPVLTDVAIDYHGEGQRAEEGPSVRRTYPSRGIDLFAGDELVLVGRYRHPGPMRVTIAGQLDGKRQEFDFSTELAERSGDQTKQFVERLWAMRRVGAIIDELDLHGRNKELVDELVRLATRHGILTPYTSFLADAHINLGDQATARRKAVRELGALEQTSGRAGVAQRAAKGVLQRALRPASGPAFYVDTKSDRRVVVHTVETVGGKTFYLKQGRWVDSRVTADETQRTVHVERFSDAYFALIDRLGSSVGPYLAIDGPVLIELEGQAYAW